MKVNEYQKEQLKKLNFKGVKMSEAPLYIQDIAGKLEKAKTRDQMYKILDDAVKQTSDFICLDETEFVGNGYKFLCTLKQYVKNQDLSKKMPSGWEFVKTIPIADSDMIVVLTKVK